MLLARDWEWSGRIPSVFLWMWVSARLRSDTRHNTSTWTRAEQYLTNNEYYRGPDRFFFLFWPCIFAAAHQSNIVCSGTRSQRCCSPDHVVPHLTMRNTGETCKWKVHLCLPMLHTRIYITCSLMHMVKVKKRLMCGHDVPEESTSG